MDAVLNYSNCPRVTRCHQIDARKKVSAFQYVKTFCMVSKSRYTETCVGLCRISFTLIIFYEQTGKFFSHP